MTHTKHTWLSTGNSKDGDWGRGGEVVCTECSTTKWFYSKGPGLGYMMLRAYNAFIGSQGNLPVPDDEREKWLAAVRAVIETPQLNVTLEKGDTILAYPNGVIRRRP